MPDYVEVPKRFEAVFKAAEDYVTRYFEGKVENPARAEILIGGERYILVRSGGFCHQFIAALKEIYSDANAADAVDLARGVLYDLAFAMGMADARVFHEATGVEDPIEKLSTGPVHFAFTGWGRVKILPDSSPSPAEDYFLHYEHPNSFESTAWLASEQKSAIPVCFMNAGYSAGWCTVSFGVPLVAVEVACRAAGGECCRFVMAHRDRINERLADYYGETALPLPEARPLMLRVREMRRQLVETRREARIHLLANEGSRESITIYDERMRIVYVNGATVEMFGYGEEELIGSGPGKVAQGGCLDAMERGVSFSGEISLRRREGDRFPAHVTASPIREDGGGFMGYYLICRDISSLKAAEKERRAAWRKLREATRDHSLAMAHAARLAAMGEMTAVMAHELNQPLGGIKNYLQGCLQEIRGGSPRGGGGTLEGALEETSRLVDKADAIIKRLREFASPGEGRMVLFSVSEVITEATSLLRPRFRREGIKALVSLPGGDPVLLGDPLRIEQVVLNLATNACDAVKDSEMKEVEVNASVVEGAKGKGTIEIVVSDTGAGVAKAAREKIFEPFYSTKKDSLGLGLSISNTIVREHGGRIRVSSRPGGGTVMTVTLPLAEEERTRKADGEV